MNKYRSLLRLLLSTYASPRRKREPMAEFTEYTANSITYATSMRKGRRPRQFVARPRPSGNHIEGDSAQTKLVTELNSDEFSSRGTRLVVARPAHLAVTSSVTVSKQKPSTN